MTKLELWLKCLELATNMHTTYTVYDDVITMAQAFFTGITGYPFTICETTLIDTIS